MDVGCQARPAPAPSDENEWDPPFVQLVSENTFRNIVSDFRDLFRDFDVPRFTGLFFRQMNRGRITPEPVAPMVTVSDTPVSPEFPLAQNGPEQDPDDQQDPPDTPTLHPQTVVIPETPGVNSSSSQDQKNPSSHGGEQQNGQQQQPMSLLDGLARHGYLTIPTLPVHVLQQDFVRNILENLKLESDISENSLNVMVTEFYDRVKAANLDHETSSRLLFFVTATLALCVRNKQIHRKECHKEISQLRSDLLLSLSELKEMKQRKEEYKAAYKTVLAEKAHDYNVLCDRWNGTAQLLTESYNNWDRLADVNERANKALQALTTENKELKAKNEAAEADLQDARAQLRDKDRELSKKQEEIDFLMERMPSVSHPPSELLFRGGDLAMQGSLVAYKEDLVGPIQMGIVGHTTPNKVTLVSSKVWNDRHERWEDVYDTGIPSCLAVLRDRIRVLEKMPENLNQWMAWKRRLNEFFMADVIVGD